MTVLTIVHNPQCECMGVGYTMARFSKCCPKIMMIFSSDSNMVNNANKNHLLVWINSNCIKCSRIWIMFTDLWLIFLDKNWNSGYSDSSNSTYDSNARKFYASTSFFKPIMTFFLHYESHLNHHDFWIKFGKSGHSVTHTHTFTLWIMYNC